MIQIRVSPRQRRMLDHEMNQFAKRAGVAVGEVVAIIGTSCAKELARKVQPWGLNQAVGDKFMDSIGMQVNNAARYAVQTGIDGSIKDVHMKLRNRKGQVRVKASKEFEPKRPWFVTGVKNHYLKQQQAKAGRAKAGWIAAGENIDSPLLKTSKGIVRKIKGIGKWIRRHVKDSNGESRFVRKKGLNSTVYLTNKVGYAYSRNNSNRGDVSSALSDGYKRSITMIKKRLKDLK